MESFRIGMIGCGTVGSGVLELLRRRGGDFERLLGRTVEVARIAVRDPDRPRHHLYGHVDPDVFTADVASVVHDPSVRVIVEVAGGVEDPRGWILAALAAGKHVVTANKATLAIHGREIFAAAKAAGRSVFYEASVAAAIPIIEMLQNGLVANQVTSLSAILNGTCNYVLTRMEADDMEYGTAVALAKEKGFAEADPTLDVSGQDSAHKLTLLARILTRSDVDLDAIHTEGIERITRSDMSFADELGYRIKLLGIVHLRDDGSWDVRVHPTLIPKASILAQVHDEFNAAFVRADAAGPILIYGYGAGSFPTASSVVADIVRAAKGDRMIVSTNGRPARYVPIADVELRNYIRVTVRDNPGVLGRITSHLGMKGINISSIRQPDAKLGHPVSVVIVTHRVRDAVVTQALETLESVGLLLEAPVRIRIED
jgi:homoserine dehydrogenase